LPVGHDPFNDDAMAGKPGERALQKAGSGFLALVRQHFAIGKPTGIVDADMQAFPTDPVMSIDRAGAASGNAVANAGDASELFGVEVQQLARARPLVAHDRRRRVERGEAIEAKSRRKTLVTVEFGMPSCRAIAGELIRCRRNRSMSAMRSIGVPRLRAGLELRSSSAVSPPPCQRRTICARFAR